MRLAVKHAAVKKRAVLTASAEAEATMAAELSSKREPSAEDEQLIQLSSINLQPDWVERQALMEKRQECLLEHVQLMSMSFDDMKKGQEEAKR